MKRKSLRGVVRALAITVITSVGMIVPVEAWWESNAPDFKWEPAKVKLMPTDTATWFLRSGDLVMSGGWMPNIGAVCAADLNDDGKEDVIIIAHSWGCGLAIHICHIFFIISDDKGGRLLTRIDGFCGNVKDIAQIGKKKYFMHSMILYGKGHNYWYYRPLGFEKDGTLKDASKEVGKPFPALTIYYNAAKFKAQPVNETDCADIEKATDWRTAPYRGENVVYFPEAEET